MAVTIFDDRRLTREESESWILDTRRKILEVYRDPTGERYRTELRFRPGEAVSPLANPGAPIPVASFLL